MRCSCFGTHRSCTHTILTLRRVHCLFAHALVPTTAAPTIPTLCVCTCRLGASTDDLLRIYDRRMPTSAGRPGRPPPLAPCVASFSPARYDPNFMSQCLTGVACSGRISAAWLLPLRPTACFDTCCSLTIFNNHKLQKPWSCSASLSSSGIGSSQLLAQHLLAQPNLISVTPADYQLACAVTC